MIIVEKSMLNDLAREELAKEVIKMKSQFNKLNFPEIPEDELEKIAMRMVPSFYCCPANDYNPVPPNTCMVCTRGHMAGECHYPKTCQEANCSHLSKYEMDIDEY